MIRIGDADIGRGVGCDVGNHIVIDTAVIGVKAHGDRDAGIERFKIPDCFFVDGRLNLVGIIFRPECDVDRARFIKGFRQGEG